MVAFSRLLVSVSAFLGGSVSAAEAEPTKVLLVTAHRSGSTFLGELFNRNEKVFYIFEPLVSVQSEHSTSGCDANFDEKTQILERYFNCSAPVYSGAGRNIDLELNSITKAKCRSHNLCFRSDMRWACNNQICNSNKNIHLSDSKDQACFKCDKLRGSDINSVCSSKSIIAQKVIRLCDVDQIGRLKESIPGLKVIFLYRDPRGIFSSRAKLIGKSLAFQTVEKTCKMYKKALDSGLGKDFMSVRYEDISINPLGAAEAIYNFIGHDMPSSVRSWISSTSEGDSQVSSGKHSSYSTNRDPMVTMSRWRLGQDFQHTQIVQSVCSDFIDEGGYLHVEDAESLVDLEVPVFSNENRSGDTKWHQF